MRKYLHFIILIIMIFGLRLFAGKIDELEKKLPTVSGEEKVQILNALSRANLERSFEKALECAREALKLAQEIHDKEGKALALKNIGVGYYYLCDFDKALEFYIKSLRVYEEIEDKVGIARSSNNIGLIYWRLKNYDKALEYNSRSLKIKKEIGDKKGIANSLNNIGLIYMDLKNYNEALEYYNKSLKTKEEIGDRKGIAESLTNIGIVNSLLNNPNKALEYLLKALKINEEIGDKLGIASALNNIGSLFRELKMYDKAFSYLEQGLKLAEEIKAKDIIQEIYHNFSEVHSVKGNYKKALEYYKLYSEVKDGIFTEGSSKEIAEMQTKYETEKKEKEIGLLKKDKVIEQSRKRMFIFLLIVTLSIIAFLIYLYRLKIKMNKKLDILSRTDPLTKLSNRRDILEKIEMERIRFERYKRPFVLVLCDIDKFKNFNDKYGHNAGDSILASIARLMRETIRMQDSVCRWGGEEFLFLLPETNLEGGRILAEKIRNKIADNIYHQEKHKLMVYMTFGVSEYDKVMSIDDCIKQADNALYEGKKKGGNQVVVAKTAASLSQGQSSVESR
ncbi:GGDEF domain-containing protein [candidate division WOR-3 bacterium]|nr:GGDEF domain-containing protein [candidate division WOR-3 bacterium]